MITMCFICFNDLKLQHILPMREKLDPYIISYRKITENEYFLVFSCKNNI